ncbi:U4/U6-U5 snRNP complex subunit SNU66 SCDLUD_000724 [Saccharomycodes ludwigii]|uniref:U4/U6-U5 snRNP complex subunit SNU66 n=1 Tax=Saccharomycodes ludwigii TaxID=36035 RepID=UPI001E8A62B8|nr:hypothetical protein SCDLUD_000724 [Saccharomycodes ludwigii]KAH3903112.1 hypothetical protein SCDLUD_000724 [Saccharomycodes ludwigii]
MGSSSIISLSIEETNIIRASFGLKPIPIPNNKNERKHFNNNNNNNNNNKFNVDYLNAYEKKNDHIDGTIRDNSLTTESVKVNSNKTSKFMHLHDHTDIDTKYTNILETNINNTNEKSDDGDWLSNIKKVVPKMRVKQQKTTLEDNERVISTNNKDIKKIITNKLILTLQETNVLDNDKDADDDKLVSNDAFDFISDAKAAGDDAHKKGFAFFTSTRTSTAINRDSQHGKPQEAVISNSTAVASTGTKKDGNKIRVLFDSDEGDSNDATNRIDYAEIKIKKRQKKKRIALKELRYQQVYLY